VTREEFIGKAADAILAKRDKYETPALDLLQREFAVEDAAAALEAVGAWDLLGACLGARSLVEEMEAGGCPDVRRYGWGDTLRAAIAKADGR
jgi:hypothetical protein